MKLSGLGSGLLAVVKQQHHEVQKVTSSPTGEMVAATSLMGFVFAVIGVLSFGSAPWIFISDDNGGRAAGAFVAIAGIWVVIVGTLAWALVALGSLLWRLALSGPSSPKASLAQVCERSVRRVTEGTGVAVLLSIVSTLFWLATNPPAPSSTPHSRINDLGLVQLSVLVLSLAALLVLELPRVCHEALEHLPPVLSWAHALVAPLVGLLLLSLSDSLDLRSVGRGLFDQFVPTSISGHAHAEVVDVWSTQLWDWVPGNLWLVVIAAWLVQLFRLGQVRRLLVAVRREAGAAPRTGSVGPDGLPAPSHPSPSGGGASS